MTEPTLRWERWVWRRGRRRKQDLRALWFDSAAGWSNLGRIASEWVGPDPWRSDPRLAVRPGTRRPPVEEWPTDGMVDVVIVADIINDLTGLARPIGLRQHNRRWRHRPAGLAGSVDNHPPGVAPLSTVEYRRLDVPRDSGMRHSCGTTPTVSEVGGGATSGTGVVPLVAPEPSLNRPPLVELRNYLDREHPNMPDTSTTLPGSVKSPAGQSITLLSDAEWAELTGHTVQAVERVYTTKVCLLRALWEHGTIRSKSGQATEAVRKAAAHYGYTGRTTAGVTALFNEALNEPAIQREINGRRCHAVTLVALPASWHRAILTAAKNLPSRGRVLTVEPPSHPEVPAPEPEWHDAGGGGRYRNAPEPAPAAVAEPELELAPELADAAERVAAHLLAQVVAMVERGNTPDPKVVTLESDLAVAQVRISSLLADNESLRNRYRDQGETLAATQAERDGLRKRLSMADHNMQAVLNGPTRTVVADAINRELTKVMTAKPAGSKGPDDTP